MDAAEIEREYLDFCERMRKDAMKLMAMAHNKRDHDSIANYALGMADTAKAQVRAYQMRREANAPGRFDLAALRVDVTTPTRSESEDAG